MRIISKFTDYYDNIQHYGQDADINYIRVKYYPEEKINLNFKDFTNFKDTKTITYTVYGFFILGFCGKLYIGEVLQKNERNSLPYPLDNNNTTYICSYISNEIELKEKIPKYNHVSFLDRPGTIGFNDVFNKATPALSLP